MLSRNYLIHIFNKTIPFTYLIYYIINFLITRISPRRNAIKIPFNVKGNAELYSNDPVKVSELPGQDFTFKKYENESK